jgi:hypothetical protein
MLTATLQNAGARDVEASEANISVREYIYFLPYPLPPGTEIPYSIHLPDKDPLGLGTSTFEPTTTLVLTSPLKTFLDIRIYKPFTIDATLASPNRGDSSHLEWAFSGTSTSVPISLPHSGAEHGKSQKRLEDETWKNLTHSAWTHWVDSRGGEPPVDEGDMYSITPDLTLEVGHAFHPELKAVKTHEEMWRDIPVLSTNAGGSKICVVLRCQADAAGVRGVVVRLGQYVQGLLVHGDKTTVERWEWHAGSTGEEEKSGWKRSVRVGDECLPCSVAMRTEVCAVGGMVKFHDFEWRVEEVWEWV